MKLQRSKALISRIIYCDKHVFVLAAAQFDGTLETSDVAVSEVLITHGLSFFNSFLPYALTMTVHKMQPPSLTGTESFRARLQRAEATHAGLMCAVYAGLIVLTITRRLAGGVVMCENLVFIPSIGLLLLATAYQAGVMYAAKAALRRGQSVSRWRSTLNIATELAVPCLLLGILHLWSPGGPHASLSAPVLLLFPLTILLSVLLLRPRITLCLGLLAAAFHWLLTARTIVVLSLPADQWPIVITYGAVLVMIGCAGMFVTISVRGYVREAVAEAEARERAGSQLAALERDLEVARQIQTGLLPAGPPRFAGFDIAGMNKPADQTGGDYYDWQELPNGRLLAVIADVTGHGIGPALVMAVCRAYARASAPMDVSPASLMARLNALLHADVIDGRFITLAMAVLEPDGQVELVSAGHGPTMLFRSADRTVAEFGGDGLPLAIIADESYGPAQRFAMQRGDVLVMLTDGVTEWQSSGGVEFGSDRVAALLTEIASEPAEQIVERIHRAVLAHAAGTKQLDDVTIVVIKRGG